MNRVKEQYDSYPYPARDPQDERKRLIRGSPSWPMEMDHHLWGGKRDWKQPLRALIAGGGTGDALVQLAQVLTSLGHPYEITYLDMSETARAIAQERCQIRGLRNITFVTGDLLSAPDLGPFDYIDCCGVLHHLSDPQPGFDALSRALAPGGGIGIMVYAPYGRSGVYPLQEAFGALSQGMSAGERLKMGQAVAAELPEGHPFRRNPNLLDHEASDAGFYDLLLHAQDRPYTVSELLESLTLAGLEPAGFVPAALYDLKRLLPKGVEIPDTLDATEQMALAEKLQGTIKTHIVYAKAQGAVVVKPSDPLAVPHLKSIEGPALAQMITSGTPLEMTFQGQDIRFNLPKAAAALAALVDGGTTLGQIQQRAGMDGFLFASTWGAVHKALEPWGELHYSRILV